MNPARELAALDLAAHVGNFRARVLQDALAEATSSYWRRRARAFREALPREGDYLGRATSVELVVRAAGLAQVALACDHAAALAIPTSDRPCDCAGDHRGDLVWTTAAT